MERIRGRVWGCLAAAAVAGLVMAACPNAAGTKEPKPVPVPGLDPAAAAALANQVEDVLVASLSTLAKPSAAAWAEGLDALAGLTYLDPEAEPLSVERCVPMPDPAADGDADGFPAMKVTLAIECEFDVLAYAFAFAFLLTGSLELLDEDDADATSGFDSKLNYRLSATAEGEALTAEGLRDLRVAKTSSAGGYEVQYRGRDVLNEPRLMHEARLTYTGTIEGRFARGVLVIEEGEILLASITADRPALALARLTVQSAEFVYDTAGCASVLTRGSAAVTARDGTNLRISYAGCGERTVTLGGRPMSAAAD